MNNVLIYTKTTCHFCDYAKKLMQSEGISYTETVLGKDMMLEDFKSLFPEQKTVPLIFIGGKKVGGYNELKEHLDNESGKTFLQEEKN